MAAVLCTFFAEMSGEQSFAVEKFHVPVARIDGVQPGPHDDFTAETAVVLLFEVAA